MIIATMMPSAYARNGSPKTSQTPVLGLGMDSATEPAPLIARDSRGSRLVDLGLQRFGCQVSEIEAGTVEKQRRRAAHPVGIRGGVDRCRPAGMGPTPDAGVETLCVARCDLVGQRNQLVVTPTQSGVGEQTLVVGRPEAGLGGAGHRVRRGL